MRLKYLDSIGQQSKVCILNVEQIKKSKNALGWANWHFIFVDEKISYSVNYIVIKRKRSLSMRGNYGVG